MHEGTIAGSILDTALASTPEGCRLKKITVACGPLSGIVKESLELYFNEIAKGTPAEGAGIELRNSGAFLECSACGNKEAFDPGAPVKEDCGKCGSRNRLECGEGVFVESIAVE